MIAPSFLHEVERAVHESSASGSDILLRVLSDVTRSSSAKFGNQYTNGTRKVFEATQEAWNACALEFSVRVQSQISRLVDEHVQMNQSELSNRLRAVRNDFLGVVEVGASKIGQLESEILHDCATHFVSAYKNAIEFAFVDLLSLSLQTCKRGLVTLLRASLHDQRADEINSTCARFYRDKNMARSVDEALCESYSLLEKMVEEGARRTMDQFRMCFLLGQKRLYEKLKLGLMNGVTEATALLTSSAICHLLQPLHLLHMSTLQTFASMLGRRVEHILSTQARSLAIGQSRLYSEAARELSGAERDRLRSGLSELFRQQRLGLQEVVVPWMLSLLETEEEKFFNNNLKN